MLKKKKKNIVNIGYLQMSNRIPLLSMNKAGELQTTKYVLDQLLKELKV